jgi:hypothetical protein
MIFSIEIFRALIACDFDGVPLAVKVTANRYKPYTVHLYDAKSGAMPNTYLKERSWLGGGGTNGTAFPGCSVQGTKKMNISNEINYFLCSNNF